MALLQIVVNEAEPGDSDTQEWKLDRLEFLGVENADVSRPGVVPVRRACNAGIMVSRRDEYLHRIQRSELLLDKFKCVRSNTFRLKEISGDEDEINFPGACVLDDAAKRASNRLSFPISEARGKTRSRKTGVQVNVGCVNKSNRSHINSLSGNLKGSKPSPAP